MSLSPAELRVEPALSREAGRGALSLSLKEPCARPPALWLRSEVCADKGDQERSELRAAGLKGERRAPEGEPINWRGRRHRELNEGLEEERA